MLVLRLASANSVDGKILKTANSKLMLERLVIRKGAFIANEDDKKGAAGLSREELMDLLKDSIPLKDEPQSGVVSDKVCHSQSNKSPSEVYFGRELSFKSSHKWADLFIRPRACEYFLTIDCSIA